jgi:hypothetical protein
MRIEYEVLKIVSAVPETASADPVKCNAVVQQSIAGEMLVETDMHMDETSLRG